MLTNMRTKSTSVGMKQIAEEAGVSMMTVSRVLRNESNVAAATEEKIRGIADRLGYKPNRLVWCCLPGMRLRRRFLRARMTICTRRI